MLCSGGLDSIVLAADLALTSVVHPIYVAAGLSWEASEREVVQLALAALPSQVNLRPLAILDAALADLYPASHWALAGTPPSYDTPDEEVYLAGRNVLLVAKAAVYCALHGVPRLCLAPLVGNSFPDATPEFMRAFAAALALGLDAPLSVEAPYRDWSKRDVILRGRALGVSLETTVSCMKPDGLRHCGECSKCRERHDAFLDALGVDPTDYALIPESVRLRTR